MATMTMAGPDLTELAATYNKGLADITDHSPAFRGLYQRTRPVLNLTSDVTIDSATGAATHNIKIDIEFPDARYDTFLLAEQMLMQEFIRKFLRKLNVSA